MSAINKESEEYIQDLEEKIVELSLKLKQKNNQLKNVSKDYQKILGKLIHNLKNPVGIISSFSEMMLEDLADYTPEKANKFLNAINSSAKFSLDILNAIAKYTQVISPEFELNLEKVNLIELIEEVVDELDNELKIKSINVVKEYRSKELFLNLDALEMKAALYNIFHNAIRYSSKNAAVTISINENNNKIELVFLDEGFGILEDKLPHIFEPFFVGDTYDNEKIKCIGLGLTIAKKIIEKHTGTLKGNSILNQGSEFKITFQNQ